MSVTVRRDPVTVLSPGDALDCSAEGFGADVDATASRGDGPVLVVGLRRGEALDTLGRLGRNLAAVMVGVADDDDLAVPDGFDVVVSPVATAPTPWVGGTDPPSVAAEVAAGVRSSPQAAVALVELLRMAGALTVHDAIVAESFVYSMLQSGPRFRDWLSTRGPSTPPATSEAPVVMDRAGDHLEIRLQRPQVHNALDTSMRDALVEAFDVVVADESVRSVRLSGAGPSFCSGGDLSEFGSSPDPATAHFVRVTTSVGALLARCADRVVADVHGACIGAGIEIPAFAGRIRATSDTTFSLPELSMGLIPGAGGTASMTRRIGRHRMAAMALGQGVIGAADALAWGLVDQIVDGAGPGRGKAAIAI